MWMLVLRILYFSVMEIIYIQTLRMLVYSFLLSKRNIKGAKKIHNQQSKKNRFTLSYIKNHTIFPKQFRRFYMFRLFYIYSLIPQYIIIVVSFFVFNIRLITDIIFSFKIVLFFFIGLFFIRNKTSIYDKQNLKKR